MTGYGGSGIGTSRGLLGPLKGVIGKWAMSWRSQGVAADRARL